MYNPTAINKCSSTCMKIISSGLNNGVINIQYTNMVPSCISGTPITISCRQFYNPVEPRVWTGFSVTTYDAEVGVRIIEQSTQDAFIDATKFTANIMPTTSFIVDPINTMI